MVFSNKIFEKRSCFNWTNDFNKQAISEKTNKINRKLSIILRTKEVNFLREIKKSGLFKNNQQTKKKAKHAHL